MTLKFDLWLIMALYWKPYQMEADNTREKCSSQQALHLLYRFWYDSTNYMRVMALLSIYENGFFGYNFATARDRTVK